MNNALTGTGLKQKRLVGAIEARRCSRLIRQRPQLVGYEKIGSGTVTVMVRGDVGAVKQP